jgi:predicted RNA-binding Zn-ribbon protein involved in translation (DUF1610 family)
VEEWDKIGAKRWDCYTSIPRAIEKGKSECSFTCPDCKQDVVIEFSKDLVNPDIII